MTSMLRARSLAVISLPALMAAAPALAATFDTTSTIDAVTVHPDAASIVRIAEIALPAGAHRVTFRGLPMNVDPASVRIEGEADGKLAIGSVESRVAAAEAARDDAGIAERMRMLRDEREQRVSALETLEGKRDMVRRFAQTSPEKLGDGAPLDIDRWSDAFDAVGGALGRVNEEMRMARTALRDTDEKIKALESANRPSEQRVRPLREIAVEVEAAAAVKGRLTLSYRVAGACWRPAYDAQLATEVKGGQGAGKASLDLVRRAVVAQRTGEDWSNVTLSVATTRVARGTQAPEMQTQRLAFWEPPVAMARKAPATMAAPAPVQEGARAEAQNADDARFRAAEQQQASLDTSAYEATFRVPGRIDVAGDGGERSLRIGARTLPADVTIRATPALDLAAYLDVAFVNDEDAPLLPGEVSLHRDGAFIGLGRFALVAQGDSVRLGFGADDRVKITRAPVRRRENEPTWLGSTKIETREFRTVVRNLHDFPIKAVIIDQMPISENSAIVIEALPATTPPSEKIVDERRGVMGWTFDLAPSATKDIRLAYRMKWPADRAVVFESAPNGAAPQPMR